MNIHTHMSEYPYLLGEGGLLKLFANIFFSLMCKLLATEIFIKMKINVLQMLLKFMLLHILYMFHGAF